MSKQYYPPLSRIANRYEVASRPLLGGMGVVYLCYDHQEQRPVALKTFKSEYLPNREARDRFLREGTTWVNLGKHTHIVYCYGVERNQDGTEVFLVLEQIAKEQGRQDASLRAWLTPGQPLSVEQALLFALQIVRGMQHACEKIPSFVHRDLKPENVLVGADWLASLKTNRLRVTDFGLANVVSVHSEQVTAAKGAEPGSHINLSRRQLTHGMVGTPLYMAPEQWTGGQVGAYTDIYALGCILFEMLTGQRAVKGQTLQMLEQAHCQGQIQALPSSLPAAVRSLVERCLRIVPENRYPAWNALASALGETWQQVSGQELPTAEAPQELAREEQLSVGWSYINLGGSYLDLGKADMAQDYFVRALAVGQAEEARLLETAALGHLGQTYTDLGNAQRAIGFYEQALVIAREIGDRQWEGRTLNNLGNAYVALGDTQQAFRFYEQGLGILREIGDRQGESSALGNLGSAHLQLGDARRAIGFYEQNLLIAREIGDRRAEGNTLGNLGYAHVALGDARRAFGFYEQNLAIAREIGDRRSEGETLNNLGNVYYKLGDARRALEFYEQALGILREVSDRYWEGQALISLGSAYGTLGDDRQALGFFEQALLITREIGDRRGEGQTLGNLGSTYANLGDARRAIGFHEQALTIAREIGDRRGEGNAFSNLGTACANLGDAKQALMFLEQALILEREMGNLSSFAYDAFNMAVLYAQQGEPSRALALAQEAARIWSQMGSPYAQRAQQFVTQLQSGSVPPSVHASPVQAALKAFQRVGSPSEMQVAIAQYPFMKEEGFIQAIEQFIVEQVRPEQQTTFQQRLAWLKQFANKKQPGLLGRLFGKKR